MSDVMVSPVSPVPPHPDSQLPVARRLSHLAAERWANRKPTVLIGRHEALRSALERVVRVAVSDDPVLLTGETGTGKELFSRAIYLFSRRARETFLSVNCAQHRDGQLIASELFGHRRGSFTGAVSDHQGVFEAANRGTVFLDEIGELSAAAQAMLLRTLSEGEVIPVGATHPVPVDVRVVAATSRDLGAMVAAGTFRPDLYYRLRYLHINIPAVRDRGDDWELIASYYLSQLAATAGTRKGLSADARQVLDGHQWPGNVREVRSVIDTGFYMSDGDVIRASDLAEALEVASRREQLARIPVEFDDAITRMSEGRATFWDAVHQPFMQRELSRAEVRELVLRGLEQTRGSYKRLLTLFGVAETDYLKFMDFLRHQRLKPEP
jgi:transcriptional regulator with PAS, ATPase and Fis domain